MPRLRAEFIERIDAFADRVLDVVAAMEKNKSPYFVRDQVGRSGTGVGASVCEASAALSERDFVKCLGTSLKELSETHYWLRMVGRRNWVKPDRLSALQDECDQLERILGTMTSKTVKKMAASEKA